MSVPEPDETRAQIARRRLAQLAASYEADVPAPRDAPPPGHRRRPKRSIDQRHVRVVAVAAVAASVVLVWWLLTGRPQQEPAAEPLKVSATSTSAPAELVIDVIGKVKRPGIVTLAPGARVHEAIEAAGGLRGRPDTTGLNMARVLADGEQIVVGISPAAGAGAVADQGAKLNLNSADLAALDDLPGVGPVTAQAILDWRTENGSFRSVDDLLDVAGIGEATLAKLRDRVTV